MTKFKLLFAIFFVLSFHVAFSSSNFQREDASNATAIESGIQSQFEENNSSPNIFGEVGSGQTQISIFSPDTECFFSHFKTKDLQLAIIQRAFHNKLAQARTLSLGSANYFTFNIPIYLQTGNFRL